MAKTEASSSYIIKAIGDNSDAFCVKCKRTLQLTEYYIHSTKSDGAVRYRPNCKSCRSQGKKSYIKNDIIRTCISCNQSGDGKLFAKGGHGRCSRCTKTEWNKNNYTKVRAQRLWGNAYKRAVKKGWPLPDFNTKWIYDKIENGYCEVTGIPFDLESEATSSVHAKNPWVPSIDRIDSSKPYLKNNVQIVVFMYNVCKSEFNHEDVVKFCNAVKQKENGKL
jgi:hypothetical protein